MRHTGARCVVFCFVVRGNTHCFAQLVRTRLVAIRSIARVFTIAYVLVLNFIPNLIRQASSWGCFQLAT